MNLKNYLNEYNTMGGWQRNYLKSKLKKTIILMLFFSVICTVSFSTVSAADYSDIRDQVNSANSGSTINLGSNTYASDGSYVRITDKNLTIQGSSNSNRATLNANDQSATFIIDSGSTLTLRYINFVSASSPSYHAITSNGTIIIEDCTFSSCNGDSGAAIYLREGATSSRITNTNFLNNKADNDGDNDYTAGGAICVHGSSNVEISNCYFSGNTALNRGGAIVIRGDATNTKIIGCTFVNNRAPDAGAIYNQLTSGTIISGCTFTNNIATENGGAIYSINFLNVSSSTFTGNSAKNGGAIYSTSTLAISSSKFSNNKASSNGGAIYSTNSLNIAGGTISGNAATYGSGVYNSGTLRLNNVSLISNNAKIIGILIQTPTSVVKGGKLVVKSYLTYGDNVANAIYTKNNNVYLNNIRPFVSSKSPGKSIILKFNNKKYTAKTDSAGIATFNINIPKTSKSGTFKAIVSYTKQGKTVTKSNDVKITSKIIINKKGNKLIYNTVVKNSNKNVKSTKSVTKPKITTKSTKKVTATKSIKPKITKISMKSAKKFVKNTKVKSKKYGPSTFMEAYDYKNGKMIWFKVPNNSNIDQYPGNLRWTTKTTKTTIYYKILLKPKNKSVYNKNTKWNTTYKFTIKYNIRGSSKKVYKVNKTSIKQNSTKLYNKYLAATTNTEVKDSRIVALAKNITGKYNSTDYSGKANAIYKWVQQHIDYTTNAPISAVAVLSSNNKDYNGHYKAYCIGFSNVIAALCRAADVPVRFQTRFYYDAYNEVPFATQLHVSHVWPEVYVNGTWLYADAAKSIGNVYPLNTETSLIKAKPANGGTYTTYDNKLNHWSFDCNHLIGVHQDLNIKPSEKPFSISEYLGVPGVTLVTSPTQAYDIVIQYTINHKEYIVKGSSFSGYLTSNGVSIADVWGFPVYEKSNNILKGYILFGINGIFYNFWVTTTGYSGSGLSISV